MGGEYPSTTPYEPSYPPVIKKLQAMDLNDEIEIPICEWVDDVIHYYLNKVWGVPRSEHVSFKMVEGVFLHLPAKKQHTIRLRKVR